MGKPDPFFPVTIDSTIATLRAEALALADKADALAVDVRFGPENKGIKAFADELRNVTHDNLPTEEN